METHEFERTDAGFGWVINHMPTILWQRKWYVFALFGMLALASVIAAYSLPTLYQSSATMLDRIAGIAQRRRRRASHRRDRAANRQDPRTRVEPRRLDRADRAI